MSQDVTEFISLQVLPFSLACPSPAMILLCLGDGFEGLTLFGSKNLWPKGVSLGFEHEFEICVGTTLEAIMARK